MRKVRREVLRAINDVREINDLKLVTVDYLGNETANQYAEYVLNNQEDEQVLKTM